LSGPEPQRTIFEKKVLAQLASYSGSTILVRGLPGPGAPLILPDGGELRVYNHLPARTLNTVIDEAGIVLSRAGYSTIMDLVKLGKKAILVPTPGQTEQEYLGSYLSGKGIALCMEQATFSLSEAIAQARDFPFTGTGTGADESRMDVPESAAMQPAENDLLQNEIRSFLEALHVV
jgi:UDP-N-acetylglucosamine transferase subunit ALG13